MRRCVPNERSSAGLMDPSPHDSDQGQLIGRDPRDLTPADFLAAGVELMPPMRAIRRNCIDCCGGEPGEVRKCVAVSCPLWPMRMGVLSRPLRAAINGRGWPASENSCEPFPKSSGKEAF
jgi:hypothetical protein